MGDYTGEKKGRTDKAGMTEEREVARRLAAWEESRKAFDLPDWESLPRLGLYMDQVILLLTQYLGPLSRGEEDKPITASIINNYVRLKVMPPPVKKKYSQVHLASLIIICVLKQSLSISDIQRMFPRDHSEEAVRLLYGDFVRQYRQVSDVFARQLGAAEELRGASGKELILTSAVLSSLAKDMTEFLLQEEPAEA